MFCLRLLIYDFYCLKKPNSFFYCTMFMNILQSIVLFVCYKTTHQNIVESHYFSLY